MEKLTLGIVHGRFQPPHNGHVRYMLAAFGVAERLLIGISTPKLCTEEEAIHTGFPCTAALNPFTFAERERMIHAALDEAGIAPERYSFIDFPSDYANIAAIIPKNAVFLMSITEASDERKIVHLESLGYKTETIIKMPESEEREHAAGVRESVHAGTDTWKTLVPVSVQKYIQEHGLLDKLK